MAITRSAEFRLRAHREGGGVASGQRSRASRPRWIFQGILGIACWVLFGFLWWTRFRNNLPERWSLIILAMLVVFVLLVVTNFLWVKWNRRVDWANDRRRRIAVVQETRFDKDMLGRDVVAPDRVALAEQASIQIGLGAEGEKVYAAAGISLPVAPVMAEVPAVAAPAVVAAVAPGISLPVAPVMAEVPAVAAPAVVAAVAPGISAVIPVVATATATATAAPVGAAVRIDWTPPSVPSVVGGSSNWQPLGRVELVATGSVDTGSGLGGYEWRSSLDGGTSWSAPRPGTAVAVEREGETMVQFRALDLAGNASEWSPGAGSAIGLVRLRRTQLPTPTVSGGSDAWQRGPQVILRADAVSLSGAFTIEHRYAHSGGAWSAPAVGGEVVVEREGETMVQFRVGHRGGVSEWAPAAGNPAGVVRLDLTPPSAPTVAGVANAWSREGGVTMRAHSATDTTSGIAGYEYRFSLDGGASWSASAPGDEVRVEAEGLTIVQFRALDGAGNPSAWSAETVDEAHAALRADAELSIRRELVVEAIADAEDITLSDDEVEARVRTDAEDAGRDPDDLIQALRDAGGWEGLRQDLLVEAAVDITPEQAEERERLLAEDALRAADPPRVPEPGDTPARKPADEKPADKKSGGKKSGDKKSGDKKSRGKKSRGKKSGSAKGTRTGAAKKASDKKAP